jgi:hypothetical protein
MRRKSKGCSDALTEAQTVSPGGGGNNASQSRANTGPAFWLLWDSGMRSRNEPTEVRRERRPRMGL